MTTLELIGLIIVWAGVVVCVLSVLGIVRFQDVFNRLHAAGLITTLGLGALALGGTLIMPIIGWKALALFLFVLLTAPVSTHMIALAAHRTPAATKKTKEDLIADAG